MNGSPSLSDFDRKRRGRVLRTIGSRYGNQLAFAFPLVLAAEQPLQEPRLADIVDATRVWPEEIRVAHRVSLERPRLIEGRRLDHRDIVVEARDRAVAASDAHVALEIGSRPSGSRLVAPVEQLFMHLGSSQSRHALGMRYLPSWIEL